MKNTYYCKLTLLFLVLFFKLPSQTITTIAGTGFGAFGGDGGPATSAWLNGPTAVAADGLGNVYICDRTNNRIRKISPSGTITTCAGTGTSGPLGDGGPATSAFIASPYGICTDAANNLYIAEFFGNRVRRVSPTGTIVTIAGTGSLASNGDGGLAINASISGPSDVAVDAAGNVYIAEWNSHKIRKINPAGYISTIAGTGSAGFSGDGGPGTSAQLGAPVNVAVDGFGNLYIADQGNYRIRKLNAAGTITTAVGNGTLGFSGDGGPGNLASINYSGGMDVDPNGNLYIADYNNNRIRMLNTGGTITTVAGTGTLASIGDGGNPIFAGIHHPNDVAFNAIGYMYIAEYTSNKIRRIQYCPAPFSPTNTTSGANMQLCGSGSATLTAAAGGTINWYQAASGGVALATGTVFITPTLSVNTTYYAEAVYCSVNFTRTPITVTVTPIPNVTGAANNSLVCQGSQVILTGSGASSYTWTGGVINNVAFTPTASAIYTVTGSNGNACQNSYAVSVVVLPPPSISIASTNTLVCQSNTTQLTASGAIAYFWTGGISNGVPFSPTVSATYVVTGISACGSLTSAITVSVLPVPTPTINISNSTVCLGNPVTITASGANSYSWSNGIINGVAFTPSISNSYVLTASNSCGTSTALASVSVNPLPVVTASASSSTVCIGSSVSLQGGGAATYTWSGGISNGISFTPSTTSNYTLQATDLNGCQNSTVKTITVLTIPSLSVNVTNPVVCSGNTTNINASGAITYSWSGGISNNTPFVPVSSSTYTVSGTNGCGTSTALATVSVNPLPNISAIASSTAICIGGSLTLQGSGTQTYTWSSGILNNTAFSPTISSTYTLNGTGSNGCQNTSNILITVNPLPNITISASNTLICSGNPLTLSGNGASTYTWSGGISNSVPFSPTTSASYSVNGTDLNGCKNASVISISVITTPVLNITASSTSVCIGNTLILTASGASSYTWSGGVTNAVAFAPSASGNFTVSGSNTCGTSNNTINITVNPLPTITVLASSPSVCLGQTATLGATGAATYTWSGGISNGQPFTPSLTTTYTVVGTDNNACTASANQVIYVNALPTIAVAASNTAVCMGGTVSLTGSGANTYTWSGGITNAQSFVPSSTTTYSVSGTNTLTGCTNTTPAVKTITVNPLPVVSANISSTAVCNGNTLLLFGSGANTYTWSGGISNNVPFQPIATSAYSVSGTNTLTGCTSTVNAVANVTVNALPVVSVSVTNPVICSGNTTAINATGANTYTNTGGITNASPFSPSVTTSYSITGTNTLTGCSSANAAVQTITVNSLPSVSVISTATAVCLGNTVSLTGTNANTFSWSGGILNGVSFIPGSTNTYSVIGTNTLTGCSKTVTQSIVVNPRPTAAVTNSALAVCAGNTVALTGTGASSYAWSGGITNAQAFTPTASAIYSVVATNTLTGCSSTNIATASLTLNSLPLLSATSSATLVCQGTPVTFSASGANTYTWSNAVANGNSFVPSSTASYTCTGTNTLTSCSNTIAQTVSVNPLPSLTVSISSPSVCLGSSVSLQATGASSFAWSGGITNGLAFTPNASQTYSVMGTNTLTGCSNFTTQSLTVNSLPSLSVTISNTQVCQGASLSLTASGANTYTWSGGITNALSFVPLLNSYTCQTTNTLTGCSNTVIQNINILPSPTIGILANASIVCSGASVILTASGANTYTWTGGVVNGITFFPTVSGNYSVTGTQTLNNCSASSVIAITVNPLPTLTISPANASVCAGGTVSLTGSGADIFLWSPNIINAQPFTPTATTQYTLVGTNTLTGCFNSTMAIVSVNPLPTITALASQTAVCDGSTITLTANGANSYTWSSGVQNGIPFTPTATTTYSVAGTNTITGCTSANMATISILLNALPNLTLASSNSIICVGETVSLTAAGANTYTWNNGLSGSSIADSPSLTTTYSVNGTDANGCSNMAVITQSVSDCTALSNNRFINTELSVYPNPSKGELFISSQVSAEISVYNETGQLILHTQVDETNRKIVLNKVANGIYFLLIKTNQGQVYRKSIIVEQ